MTAQGKESSESERAQCRLRRSGSRLLGLRPKSQRQRCRRCRNRARHHYHCRQSPLSGRPAAPWCGERVCEGGSSGARFRLKVRPERCPSVKRRAMRHSMVRSPPPMPEEGDSTYGCHVRLAPIVHTNASKPLPLLGITLHSMSSCHTSPTAAMP